MSHSTKRKDRDNHADKVLPVVARRRVRKRMHVPPADVLDKIKVEIRPTGPPFWSFLRHFAVYYGYLRYGQTCLTIVLDPRLMRILGNINADQMNAMIQLENVLSEDLRRYNQMNAVNPVIPQGYNLNFPQDVEMSVNAYLELPMCDNWNFMELYTLFYGYGRYQNINMILQDELLSPHLLRHTAETLQQRINLEVENANDRGLTRPWDVIHLIHPIPPPPPLDLNHPPPNQ